MSRGGSPPRRLLSPVLPEAEPGASAWHSARLRFPRSSGAAIVPTAPRPALAPTLIPPGAKTCARHQRGGELALRARRSSARGADSHVQPRRIRSTRARRRIRHRCKVGSGAGARAGCLFTAIPRRLGPPVPAPCCACRPGYSRLCVVNAARRSAVGRSTVTIGRAAGRTSTFGSCGCPFGECLVRAARDTFAAAAEPGLSRPPAGDRRDGSSHRWMLLRRSWVRPGSAPLEAALETLDPRRAPRLDAEHAEASLCPLITCVSRLVRPAEI